MRSRNRAMAASDWQGEDRLSSLHDSLLLRILDFLGTKVAVRTCVLSKRWRHLWTCLSTLSFTSTARIRKDCKRYYYYMIDKSFENLVTQVLIGRGNCPLRKFKFTINKHIRPCLLESLLDYALENGVQDINVLVGELEYRHPPPRRDVPVPFVWPTGFLNCQSLHKLNLGSLDAYIRLPKNLVFTSLKILCITRLRFSKDQVDGSYFPSCPNLEDLCLCNIRFDHELKIAAPSLRTLDFRFYNYSPLGNKVVIVAPRLTTIKYSGFWPMSCSLGTSSLEDVDICLHPYEKLMSDIVLNDDFILNSIKMVNEFRVTKSVTINVKTIKVLSANQDLLEEGHLSKFNNLKRLTVEKDCWKDFETFCFPLCLTNHFLNDSTELKVICPRWWKGQQEEQAKMFTSMLTQERT